MNNINEMTYMVFYDKYERGASIRVNVNFQDRNDVYIDPTTPIIKITAAAGTVIIDDVALTKSVTGKYYYIWDNLETITIGNYTIRAKGTYSGHIILNRSVITLTDSTVSS